jgi:adenylate cyclase
MDFEGAGLLDDLEGEERDARRRLLERLSEEGVGIEELKAAVAEERLALVPVERALRGRYTAAQVARKTKVSTELVTKVQRAMGLSVADSDEKVFSDEDVEALHGVRQFLEAGFDEKAVIQVSRVLGEGMSRLSATVGVAFGEAFLNAGDSEDDVAMRFASMAQELTPAVAPILAAAFRAHLHEDVSRAMLRRTDRQSGQVGGEQELAVCFADLVGFTRLGGEIEVQELGTVAEQLAELAADLAAGPVRLVKTIGDAAMFVSREVPAQVEVALELVEAVERADLPALRAGIAFGPAFQRAGDFYGNSVNLASRVTGTARPGSVLCTPEVKDAAEEGFEWSFAGKHKLKGLQHSVALHRARKPGGETGDGAKKPKADRRRK